MGTQYEKSEITRPKGINKDLSPYELPPDMWSDGINVSFRRNRVSKALGYQNFFELTDTVVQPLYHIYYTDDVDTLWFYASETDIYRTDGATTASVGTGYSATRDVSWTGCNFNGVLIFNNRVDHPQSFSKEDGVAVDLPNWGSTVIGGVPTDNAAPWGIASRAEVIRPFKNYLMALDIYDQDGNRYSDAVRWSSPATLDDVPPSWDPALAGEQAGLYNLADTLGRCVDGLTLGDYFVIYKTDAVWLVDLIGGDVNMRFRKLFGDESGILTKECVAEFEGKHFVMSPTGAYVHNGATKEEVMEQWVRDEFFGTVAAERLDETKVVADHTNREIWIYYTTKTSLSGWPDKALIWNWDTTEWTIKELTGISYIAEGIIEPAALGDDSWDSDSQAWNLDDTEWGGEIGFNPLDKGLLLADYVNSVFYANEASGSTLGVNLNGYVERIGLDMEMDYAYKEVTRVTPHMLGQTPVTVNVYAEDLQTGSPVLIETAIFDPLVDQYIDCHAVGRYFGFRFEGTGLWTMTGYTVHWKILGEF